MLSSNSFLKYYSRPEVLQGIKKGRNTGKVDFLTVFLVHGSES